MELEPSEQDVKSAIFGSWDFKRQKRKPGLLDRMARIEFMLLASVPVLVARALGIPTDIFGKFFSEHGGVAMTIQHVVAFFVGIPK